MEMLIIGLWVFFWIVFGFLTFFALILSLILKDKNRSIAVDLLLTLASITLLIMSASSILPLPKSSKVKMKAPFEVRLKQVSSTIETANSFARIQDGNKVLSYLINLNYPVTNSARQLNSARSSLAGLVSDYPDSNSARLAYTLFLRKFGGDLKLASKNAQAGSVYSLVLRPVFESNKAPPEESLNQVYEVIDESLPDGWFKQEAFLVLKSVEKADSGQLEKEIKQRQLGHDKKLLPVLIFYIVTTYIATLAGAVILFKCFQSSQLFKRGRIQIEYLTGRKVLGVVLIVSYVLIAISLVLNMLPIKAIELSANLTKSIEILLGCLIGLVVAVVVSRYVISKPVDKKVLDVLDLKFSIDQLPAYLKDGLWGLMLCTLIYGVVWVTQSMIVGGVNSENPINWQMEALANSSAYFELALTAFAVVIVGPAFEELLFRALLYRWFRTKCDVLPAAIASSLIFAAYHFDFQMMPGLTMMGIAMALTYEKSGSLYASIFLHAFINAWFVFCTQFVR